MATFFGEVLPVISRAVDEDEEEEDDDTVSSVDRNIVLKWEHRAAKEFDKSGDKLRLKCKVLVIAVGPIACGFVRACLLPRESTRLGTLTYEEHPGTVQEEEQRRASRSIISELHRSSFSKEAVFCLNHDPIPAEFTFQFTHLLFSNVCNSDIQIAILYARHVAEYQSSVSTAALSVPFLKSLKSSAFSSITACSLLEQPNTVSGLPASVLTHCQVLNIPAVLYTSYTDVMDVDSVNMCVFKPILKSRPFNNVIHENPNRDKYIMDVSSIKKTHGNLYL